MMLAPMELICTGFIIQVVIMAATWQLGKSLRNFSVVDVVWCYSFILHALLFFFLTPGWLPRKFVLLGMVVFWGLRLALYMTKRTYSRHPKEDPRYVELRAEYGANLNLRFFLFFQVQAVIISMMTVPYALAFANVTPEFAPVEWVGIALWLVSFIGETVADAQKGRFRSDPANSDKICQVGLWRYSRHPNYFFESLIWWSFYVFALASGGWFAIFSPLIILLLLVKVSGIPITERYEVKRFGEKFRAYQASTSAFVPWWPK